NAIRHEQDCRRVLPDRLEPRRLGARMQQRDAVAVLGELADPGAHLVAIERWIDVDESEPITIETMAGPIDSRAFPRARLCSTRVQVERAEPIDDPFRRNMILRAPNGLLVRSKSHWRSP